MRTVVDCVSSFIPLLSTEYEIVLGRKNVAVKLIITFDKKDCFHLMGLQYLTDRPELRRDRGKIFDEIQKGIIKKENIELKSAGKQRRSYCYVSDVVTALFFIMNCEKHNQIYNVSNKESIVTISELAHKIAEIGGTKVVYVEANLLEKQGYSKTRDAVLDEGKLRKQGWIPKKNIDQGVEMTIRILQNEKGL